MSYQRKTFDTWEVQSYCPGEGWSTEHTEQTRRAALKILREYQENAPLTGPYRVKLVREPIANERMYLLV